MEPGCLASKGRGSASFRCLRDYSVPIGQRRSSGAESREYPRPVLGSPATVGGLTSWRRESGARPRPRPIPDSPRPAPRCACSLVPQALSRAPDSTLLWLWPDPAPCPPTHAPHADAANVRFPRVLRTEALAGFLLCPLGRVVAPSPQKFGAPADPVT